VREREREGSFSPCEAPRTPPPRWFRRGNGSGGRFQEGRVSVRERERQREIDSACVCERERMSERNSVPAAAAAEAAAVAAAECGCFRDPPPPAVDFDLLDRIFGVSPCHPQARTRYYEERTLPSHHPSNHLLQVLHLYCSSPESGDVRYKLGRLKKTICPPPLRALFHQKSTCLTESTLRPHVVQIWSRNVRKAERTKPSNSTVRVHCPGRGGGGTPNQPVFTKASFVVGKRLC